MKNKISAILAIVITFAYLPVHMNASAEIIKTYPDWCNGFDFENHKANFVITGAYYSGDSTTPYEYSVTYLTNYSINEETGNKYWSGDCHEVIGVGQLTPYLENTENLKIGDLLYIPVFCVAEVVPGCIHIDQIDQDMLDAVEVDYIGNGKEIFGDEFMKAVRNDLLRDMDETYMNPWTLGSNQRYETFDIINGDATEDGEVSIADVVMITKAVLGKESMQGYSQYVSDINKNWHVDASDALSVMQYIVGLIDEL
ncbi:MAG: dockerin type I repeat-containing protein [Oscillospiraceae bacterium]|nr:dockerin type I repeat-containing protein [Oscillospiraceae bacterium]